jgi:hypothetical protein
MRPTQHRTPALRLGAGVRSHLVPALALAGAALLFGAGCPGEREAPPEKPTRPIEAVRQDHADELLAIPGVVGFYPHQRDDGTPVLRVMVVKRTPELDRKLPRALEGYPVEIEVTGEIRPLEPGPR